MTKFTAYLLPVLFLCSIISKAQDMAPPQVKTANGILEGIEDSGIRVFKGVAYAAAPVGNLRWKEPQPLAKWTDVHKADHFGPRAMQLPLFSDMNFRSAGVSEDCLYLNVWTPAKTASERLPVMVYFYGGGFAGGDGSEYRYDGENMARQGIIAVTVNYRLSVFGFLAHPELTKESPHHASGNYGLMDQAAALKWVSQNIAAFGGDPKRVTIAGESAGSYSVCAQMASPLSKNLIAGAIGESGSLLGFNQAVPLSEAEAAGVKFAEIAGAKSIAELRAMSAQDVLNITAKPNASKFAVTVDGYFFPAAPLKIYQAGQQAHVPMLAGWNSEENNYRSVIGRDTPNIANYTKAVQKLYGADAADVLKVYQAKTDADVQQVATDLASDRFIAFGTWKWTDVHAQTGGKPVYRYYYERARPTKRGGGAVHSAEIEYALGNLPTNRVYDWQPDDYKISTVMQSYFVNFIKTGNPNGATVPLWPAAVPNQAVKVMHINIQTQAKDETVRERYLLLDKLNGK